MAERKYEKYDQHKLSTKLTHTSISSTYRNKFCCYVTSYEPWTVVL